jgi:hypothetical protein
LAINLDGWTLRDEDGHRHTFHDSRFAGRSTVHVHTGQGRDSRTDVYHGRRNYVWDNRSDTSNLRNDPAASSTTSPGAATATAPATDTRLAVPVS